MQYFILLSADSDKDCFQETNLLGETSRNSFYAGTGFRVLNTILNKHPDVVSDIRIITDTGRKHTIEEFLDIISPLKIIKN
jgi:hypothetical protein